MEIGKQMEAIYVEPLTQDKSAPKEAPVAPVEAPVPALAEADADLVAVT